MKLATFEQASRASTDLHPLRRTHVRNVEASPPRTPGLTALALVLLALALMTSTGCKDPLAPKCEGNDRVYLLTGTGVGPDGPTGVSTSFPVGSRVWFCSSWEHVERGDKPTFTLKADAASSPYVREVVVPEGVCGPWSYDFALPPMGRGAWHFTACRFGRLCSERAFSMY